MKLRRIIGTPFTAIKEASRIVEATRKDMGETSRGDIAAECGVSKGSNDKSTNGVPCDEVPMNQPISRTNIDAFLQLDDEALFGIIKKLACNGLRQILSGSIDPDAGSSNILANAPCLDGFIFKKALVESIHAHLSDQTSDDVTALYLKHAKSSNELVHVHVQSAMVDLTNYFCHNGHIDKIPHGHADYGCVAHTNDKGREATAAVKSNTTAREGQIAKDDCHEPVRSTEGVLDEFVAVVPEEFHGGNTTVPVLGSQKVSSSDTVLIPSCGGYSSSAKDLHTNTKIISSSSPTISDSVELSQVGPKSKRKRVSSPMTLQNSETIGATIAGRTRSRRSSLSPVVLASDPTILDNPESILRRNSNKRIATKMIETCQNLEMAHNAIDVGDDSAILENNSATLSYMLREDISSHKPTNLDPPYVNISQRGPRLDVGCLHTSEYPQAGLGLPNPPISASRKDNMWNFSVPSFDLIDELNGCTHVVSHNEILSHSNICDAQNSDIGPVWDKTPLPRSHEIRDHTPDAIPLAAHDTSNVDDLSCFDKCKRIRFNLGSSSKDEIGKSRRPRRIVQPNSYFRNFQVNVCTAKYGVVVHETLVYECVLFYSQFSDHARDEAINYSNVRVNF